MPLSPHRWPRIRLALVLTYVALVVASNLWTSGAAAPPPAVLPPPIGAERLITTLPDGVELSAIRWPAAAPKPDATPVILVHGGPGQGRDFAGIRPTQADPGLAAMLAATRDVYAIDLLGFGGSTRDAPDYSILANARAVLAWMKANGIPRAHILGWSQGGGVVLHMADLAPESIASVTLAAGIGMQETEGSRSYAFEHVRYGLGDRARRYLPRLVPHFGALQVAPPAFTRYFADTDQRPLGNVLHRLRVPLLVLHGRKDFLIPHWAAIEHARAAPREGTQVIMTPWSHFLPFWSLDKRTKAAGWLYEFWSRADARHESLQDASQHARPARESGPSQTSDSPWSSPTAVYESEGARVPRLFGQFGARRADLIVLMPWWSIASILTLLSARRVGARWSIAIGAMLVVCGLVDYAVVFVALAAGGWLAITRAVRRAAAPPPILRDEWRERARRGTLWCGVLAVLRPDLRAEIGVAVRSLAGYRKWAFIAAAGATIAIHRLLLQLIAMIVIAVIVWDPFHPLREFGVLLGLAVARVVIAVVDHLLTIPGRQLLRTSLARSRRFEFWPTWLVCFCMGPMFVRETLRTRHPLAFTACNPGIENGGGAIGESKFAIMRAWRTQAERSEPAAEVSRAICRTWLLPPGELVARVTRLESLLADSANDLRYPLVLKPDAGQRGFSVRIARTRDVAERAMELVPTPLLVQPWHPGPGEVGVVWMRREPHTTSECIFSVTLKQFSVLEGDGVHTIEELIWRHPRFRLQASTFLKRLAGRRLDVLKAGERLSLGLAGNHCQGTLFRDGAALITPELASAVDRLVRAYRGTTINAGDAHAAQSKSPALDMVRLDIRYRDEAALRAGVLDADSIVELNGTLGESTNIYDPNRPLPWSLGVLRSQWEFLYRRGGERMREGYRPMSVLTMLRSLWTHYTSRRGSSLAD